MFYGWMLLHYCLLKMWITVQQLLTPEVYKMILQTLKILVVILILTQIQVYTQNCMLYILDFNTT